MIDKVMIMKAQFNLLNEIKFNSQNKHIKFLRGSFLTVLIEEMSVILFLNTSLSALQS